MLIAMNALSMCFTICVLKMQLCVALTVNLRKTLKEVSNVTVYPMYFGLSGHYNRLHWWIL